MHDESIISRLDSIDRRIMNLERMLIQYIESEQNLRVELAAMNEKILSNRTDIDQNAKDIENLRKGSLKWYERLIHILITVFTAIIAYLFGSG